MRRIVLDTNCLLAVLPSRSPYHSVWETFMNGQVAFCASNEVLAEYEEIISAKTTPMFAAAIIKAIINRPNLIKVAPTWRFHLIESDPDDNKFVDCALCGGAELIVSNDRHFSVLNELEFPYIKVMSLQDYVSIQ